MVFTYKYVLSLEKKKIIVFTYKYGLSLTTMNFSKGPGTASSTWDPMMKVSALP